MTITLNNYSGNQLVVRYENIYEKTEVEMQFYHNGELVDFSVNFFELKTLLIKMEKDSIKPDFKP